MNLAQAINTTQRNYEAYVDRLHDEHYGDLPECPQCGEEALEVTGGRDRRGWWSNSECLNDECDYTDEAFDIYDDY
jgi:hypothetical protein